MKTPTLLLSVLSCLLAGPAGFAGAAPPADEVKLPELRAHAKKLQGDANPREALDLWKKLVLAPTDGGSDLAMDYLHAVECLRALGRWEEFDPWVDQVLAAHPQDWRLLSAVAQSFGSAFPNGSVSNNTFHRGTAVQTGRFIQCQQQDHLRSLQLRQRAMTLLLAQKDTPPDEARQFYLQFAQTVAQEQASQLLALTDLKKQPDYLETTVTGPRTYRGRTSYVGASMGTPVGPDGLPIYHHLPASWESAATDGERWRWLLAQAAKCDRIGEASEKSTLAEFMESQIGEATLAQSAYGAGGEKPMTREEIVIQLKTLTDDEALAWLGGQVKRFPVPDEFNPLKLFLQVAEMHISEDYSASAWSSAARILEYRHHLTRAAELLRRIVTETKGDGWRENAKERLKQITGHWGAFEASETQLAGKEATVDFSFRNATKVSLSVRPISVSDLLSDVKSYLRQNPKELDYEKLNIDRTCAEFIDHKGEKYLQKAIATFSQDLEPAPEHEDKVTRLTIPVRAAGAYWVEAQLESGNRVGTIVWLQDTLLLRKAMEGGVMYLVVDAATGAPVEGATVELFGYSAEIKYNNGPQRERWDVKVRDFSEFSNANGVVMQHPDEDKDRNRYLWMGAATTKAGRLATLGFGNGVGSGWADQQAQPAKNYLMTDRPVYRPQQEVQLKIWRARADYGKDGDNPEGGAKVQLEVKDPRGQTIYKNSATLDAAGGFADKLSLPANATLGAYQVLMKKEEPRPPYGYFEDVGSFRVEEYKKPEFEVTVDAPQEPITLGGKVTATVHARYYFGSPVAEGTVHYKVQRSAQSSQWYPVGPWDWLYGNGYGWFASDALWYPGWSHWGCAMPHWSWMGWNPAPPELIADGEAKLEVDGTYKIEIDTAKAKEHHGDTNHTYTITAEVTDASRRVITGSGSVTAAQAPFKVYLSLDHGYYQVGEPMEALIHAFTADHQPVEAQGKLRLLSIGYDAAGKPTEKQVGEWDLKTDADGQASQKLSASEPGQYRIACSVTDAKGRTEEGAQLLVIRGPGFDGRQFRFNALELIPDRREYAPNDEVKLLINTEQANGYVVLFERASGGACKEPRFIHLAGKSEVVSLKVTAGDAPNRFIEAFTVAGGRMYHEVREIAVPPQKRILNLTLDAPEKAKPHEKATLTLKLTDTQGHPCTGDVVLTMYDKSLEYISGGSNITDIKSFFWGWKRSHYPSAPEVNLRYFSNLTPSGKTAMQPIGLWWPVYTNRGFAVGGAHHFLSRASFVEQESPLSAGLPAASAAFTPDSINGLIASDKDANRLDFARKAMLPGLAPEQLTFAPPPMIRTQFADTAVWITSAKIKDDGVAQIPVDLPDNLTTWKLRAWALGPGTRVAETTRELTTSKDLLVRLQAPRFFVEQDEVTLSANVHNYLPKPQQVRVTLDLSKDELALTEGQNATQVVQLNPNSETRVDWRAKVLREGSAKLKVTATGQDDADAMELTLPVHVHGMLRTESWSLALKQDQTTGKIEFTVPDKRRAEQTVLEVRSSPSLASAMVEALPYLADFPYGCTEQTLNRFLPSALTRETLLKFHIKLGDLAKPQGPLPPDARKNPVYDDAKLDNMVRTGLERLMNMQNADGGWGWFFGAEEHSYPHTTATVVHGLLLAERAHLAVPPDALKRGVAWLKQSQAAELQKLRNAPNHVEPWKDSVSEQDALVFSLLTEAGEWDKAMGESLYKQREPLSVYSKALLGLAFDRFGQAEQRDMLLRNIEQFLEVDAENQSAHLRLPIGGYWWYWYGSEVETTATYLKLLCKTKPHGENAAGIAKFLVNHRRHGSWWNSTRDTALSVEALADYLTASGEGDAAMNTQVELWLDGKKRHEVTFTRDTLFAGKDRLEIRGEELTAGKHTLEIRKAGNSRLYVNASLAAFTLEDNIPAAGLEVKVTRHYWKLTPKDVKFASATARGAPLEERKEAYTRTEIKDGDEVKSGDLIEAELIAESKNDYEYILVEDMKASGFEPVDVRSGYIFLNASLPAYLELHDERAAFFLRELPLGSHSLFYRLRAETPGVFHALPTKISAMYAPDLKGNSAELHVRVVDAEKAPHQ